VKVARGDSLFDDDIDTQLKSELPGVEDAAWTRFVCIMATSNAAAVSPSNALGMFELMPRRLADLGVVNKLARSTKGSRTVWTAAFIAPLTSDKFLRNPQIQYRVFCVSMKDYADRLTGGKIAKPEGMSLSGALAICHRAGPEGLKGKLFPSTQAMYEKAQDVF
jgi:hypothetical protein